MTTSVLLSERPANRLREYGPRALSTAETVAALLGDTDTARARAILAVFPTLSRLAQATEAELCEIAGIGPALAARVLAALELGRRLTIEAPDDRWQIRAPSDAAHILRPMLENLPREHFVVVVLDTRNRVLHQETLYSGTLNTSMVRIAEVFRVAMRHNGAGLVVAHNHPSGDPAPSPEDVALTRRLVETGKALEMDVLDHLVIGAGGRYVSLRERALGFETA